MVKIMVSNWVLINTFGLGMSMVILNFRSRVRITTLTPTMEKGMYHIFVASTPAITTDSANVQLVYKSPSPQIRGFCAAIIKTYNSLNN